MGTLCGQTSSPAFHLTENSSALMPLLDRGNAAHCGSKNCLDTIISIFGVILMVKTRACQRKRSLMRALYSRVLGSLQNRRHSLFFFWKDPNSRNSSWGPSTILLYMCLCDTHYPKKLLGRRAAPGKAGTDEWKMDSWVAAEACLNYIPDFRAR